MRRLLDSIAIQTFTDFEVIITDDSPGAEISELIEQYSNKFPLLYQKNPTALGTPGNWNEGISKASGQWIKLMHHDDWFASSNSLQQFADNALRHPNTSFFFSTYRNIYEDSSPPKDMFRGIADSKKLSGHPEVLLANNFIGPPSVVMYRNNSGLRYDAALKWLVDMDFYILHPGIRRAYCIKEPLVCIGVHASQVTASAFRNRTVEIPEYLYELNKLGAGILRHMLVFDAYWRLIRNFGVRKTEDIREAGFNGNIPPVIVQMIQFQRRLPAVLLRFGLFSKLCMFACYLYCSYFKRSV